MVQDIPVRSVLDRCLSVAGRCISLDHGDRARAFMIAQFEEIAEEVALWGLTAEEKVHLILRPTHQRLISRFGRQVGWELYRDFVDAFWQRSWVVAPVRVNETSEASMLAV